MRSRVIDSLYKSEGVNITQACGLLGYSKQAYYKSVAKEEKEAFQADILLDLIKTKRGIWKRGGGKKLYASLKEELERHHIKIGRDKFYQFLKAHELLIKRKKTRPYSTNSNHHYRKHPNLIVDLEVERINHLWVSDMTYIYVRSIQKYGYLFLITDAYNREVIGYCFSLKPDGAAAVRALRQALRNRGITKHSLVLYHHSDRGIQYCCNKYVNILKGLHINISMTENSDPRENAIAERVNGILKIEFTEERKLEFNTFREGQKKIKEIIRFYNEERPHSSIERMTPVEARNCTGPLKRLWKNYYKEPKSL